MFIKRSISFKEKIYDFSLIWCFLCIVVSFLLAIMIQDANCSLVDEQLDQYEQFSHPIYVIIDGVFSFLILSIVGILIRRKISYHSLYHSLSSLLFLNFISIIISGILSLVIGIYVKMEIDKNPTIDFTGIIAFSLLYLIMTTPIHGFIILFVLPIRKFLSRKAMLRASD